MEACVDVVRGRQVITVDGCALRGVASAYDHVVIDIGTGDGRRIYRVARTHPRWFCLGSMRTHSGCGRSRSRRVAGPHGTARYVEAGMTVTSWKTERVDAPTSWGRRVGQGTAVVALTIDARIGGAHEEEDSPTTVP